MGIDPRNVAPPVGDITLTPRTLTIALARLRRLDRGVQREEVRFVDVDGEVFHRTPSTAILSLGLLLALIEELQPPV